MSTMPRRARRPASVSVRMYQVGFGDCFLLSFRYRDETERHMLVDFGTTSRPQGSPTALATARSIAERTDGRLDVLVVTHRHRDHLSAFGARNTGDILAQLKPQLIVMPWTEDPDADANAIEPANRLLLGAISNSFGFAAAVNARTPQTGLGAQSELVRAARQQLANASAVASLAAAAQQAQTVYTHADEASAQARIAEFLPGVEVGILGPPTPQQWPEVQHQRAANPEYWMVATQLLKRFYAADSLRPVYDDLDDEVGLPLPTTYRDDDPPPGPARWIAARLRRHELAAMTNIVRWLDDALNNTSLIMLIQAAGKRILLGGDAQIENWGWALAKAKADRSLRYRLANIDLYKVGHHGSRNGTPRSLHELWVQARRRDRPRMVALMSTRAGVHGKTDATAVPRRTLIDALMQVADVYSTDGASRPFIEAIGEVQEPGFRVPDARPLTRAALDNG
jgi:hypothetical protein